jgi:multicomponent Na+:H+ antiporter subunit G
MNAIVEIVSALCLLAGAFFMVVGCIGLVRMPDRYTRMHAASVTDTLGAGLLLFGLLLQAGLGLTAAKLVMLGLLIFFASPTATHALARAAFMRGRAPSDRAREQRPSTR